MPGFAALALAAPAGMPAYAKVRVLQGTVSYRERVALPPHATLQVRLLRASAAECIFGRHRRRAAANAQPHANSLSPALRRSRLRRGHTYALEARILVDGKVWFDTIAPKPVANGAIQPEILVQRVAAQAPASPF